MKISSWNVNSVRARISNIITYLKNSKVDILMIQEIKTESENFPFDDFKKLVDDAYKSGNDKDYQKAIAFASKKKKNMKFGAAPTIYRVRSLS